MFVLVLSLFSFCISLPRLRSRRSSSAVCVQLIEDLRRELEHLQMFKLEAERPGRARSSSSGLSDFGSRTRELELEHEVRRLKQVETKTSDSIAFAACEKSLNFHMTAKGRFLQGEMLTVA